MYTRGCGIFSHTRTYMHMYALVCMLGTLIEERCKGPKGQRKNQAWGAREIELDR